jgi:uncharacterized protein YecT (DUF1311 family)
MDMATKMKNSFVLLSLISGFFAVPALAQDGKSNCTDPQSRAEMNYCSNKEYKTATASLNKVFKKALKKQQELDNLNAESGPDNVGAEKSIVKAQRAWTDYRDGTCDTEGYQVAGGSMQPTMVMNCRIRLTLMRIKELKESLEN